MQAIVQDRYGQGELLRLEQVPTPQPRDLEVLVRVVSASVHRGDWHFSTGLPGLLRLGFGLRGPRNRVPGTDLAGIVEATGPLVTRFKPGDAVFGVGSGAFAEYAVAPEKHLAPMPAGLSFDEAAALPTSGLTALHACRAVGLQPGERVLVLGASGGVGLFAVQVARAMGGRVTAVASAAKLELVRAAGAEVALDYASGELERSGERFEAILDIGGRRSFGTLCRLLTPHGRVVLIGGEGGNALTGGFERNLFAPLVSRFVSQRLSSLFSTPSSADLAALAEMVEAGHVRPTVGQTYPLARAGQALDDLGAGCARGKLVIQVAAAPPEQLSEDTRQAVPA